MAHDQFWRWDWPMATFVLAVDVGHHRTVKGWPPRILKSGHRVTRTDMMRAQRAHWVAKWTRPKARQLALERAEAAGRCDGKLTDKERRRVLTCPALFKWRGLVVEVLPG